MNYLTGFTVIFFISIMLFSCSKKREHVDSIDGWIFANVTDAYDIGKEDEKNNGEPVYFLGSNRKVDTGFGGDLQNIIKPCRISGKKSAVKRLC